MTLRSRNPTIDMPEDASGSEDNGVPPKRPVLLNRVSLESDSFTEGNTVPPTRRKKRMTRKSRPIGMEVDPHPSCKKERQMDVDGEESHISSSDTDEEHAGGEADDEQSDWVGYSGGDSELLESSDRDAGRRVNPKKQMSQLQKRLERFALEGSKGEMGIEFKIKDRPNSAQFNRMLLQYRLEVVKRQRGNVVLRRKHNNCAAVTECE